VKRITVEEKCNQYCSNTDNCKSIGKTRTMRKLCEKPQVIKNKQVKQIDWLPR